MWILPSTPSEYQLQHHFLVKNACILIQIQSVTRNTLRAQTSVMPGLSVKLSIQVWDSMVKVAQKSKKRNPRDIDLDISPTWKFHEMLLIAFPLIFLTDIHPSPPTPKIEKNCMLVTIMLVKVRQTDRWKHRWTNGRIERQMYRETNRQKDTQTENDKIYYKLCIYRIFEVFVYQKQLSHTGIWEGVTMFLYQFVCHH